MHMIISLNARNLSNSQQNPTFGLKIPIRYIRALANLDPKLANHLSLLASGQQGHYSRDIELFWPLRTAQPIACNISYTYTGRQLPNGSYSSQAHIAVTQKQWTPWIRSNLAASYSGAYFQGLQRDMVVISAP